MAAGPGLRMNGSTMRQSKTILPIVGGVPLLRQTIDTLQCLELEEIVVVVGYDHENVTKILSDMGVTIVRNNQYREANSIVSAYMCMSYFEDNDDLLIMNGDSYYETSLFRSIVDDPRSPVLLVDRDRRHHADVKVLIEDGVVIRYGKELDEQPHAESADLVKLSAQHARVYGQSLHASVAEGDIGCYWEDVLFRMNSVRIIAKDAAGVFWTEIDRFEDYRRLVSHFDKEKSSQLGVPARA